MPKSIAINIYKKLYKKDIDFTLNIFLCGADTGKTNSLRHLINEELGTLPRFNIVYPEFLFATLLGRKDSNLLELEDELAKYVDLIIIPLEGMGTLAEIGAFSVNKKLLPKLIVINDVKYRRSKSFINLGPVDLIQRHNKNHVIYFERGNEKDFLKKLISELNIKRYSVYNTISYDLENIFNLSRYLFYLIAIFQPVTKRGMIEQLNQLTSELSDQKIKLKYIDASIQILVQKNRIEKDIDYQFQEVYSLSQVGHIYVYDRLLPRLGIQNEFSDIRLRILKEKLATKKRKDWELKLLALK